MRTLTMVSSKFAISGIKKVKYLFGIVVLSASVVLQTLVPATVSAAASWSGSFWNIEPQEAPTMPVTAPVYQNSYESIDFEWGSGSPEETVNNDGFVAEWTKTDTFVSGLHAFSVLSDDGVRVYIDDELILDKWFTQGGTDIYTIGRTLTAGSHTLKVQYFENTGGALLHFDYKSLTYQGDGTEASPYLITNCEELQNIKYLLDKDYKITQNIDCAETQTMNNFGEGEYYGFEPIGSSNKFSGVIDGNNKTVSNVYINRTDSQYVGLIGRNEGTVKNLTFSNMDIAGGYRTGGIVGENDGELINISTAGTINGSDAVGGLVGANREAGIISESDSSATVTASNSRAGGIAGANGGTISTSYATGTVTAVSSAGGLVGRNGGDVVGSYATGYVSGTNDLGGLVGSLSGGLVKRSYATGHVTGTGQRIGGLVGRASGRISRSYATGDVEGNNRVGGLTGANGGTISNSYARGSVSGDNNVGGLSGRSGGNIVNSYATGAITANSLSGGLVGYTENGIATDSFWDVETSGTETSALGTGKSTIEMKTQSTFADNNWLFGNIWAISESLNDGYPYLNSANPEQMILLVSGYGNQNDTYFDRTGYEYTEINSAKFANASVSYFLDYDIVIYEPNSDYDNLKAGLVNLTTAMQQKEIVVSIRVAGNSGSQQDIDFLGTDYNRDSTHESLTFEDSGHPLFTGEGYDGYQLQESDFNNWNSTDHGWLENLPVDQEGYAVLARNENGPNIIEYGYQKGWVLLDTLTSVDGNWGDGNDNYADNYIRYLVSVAKDYQSKADPDNDSDGDGIKNGLEDSGPNSGDANNDGIKDKLQKNVTSFVNTVTGAYSVLSASTECTNESVTLSGENTKPVADSGFDYPAGLMSFTLGCGTPGFTATVMQYHYGVTPETFVLRKFNNVTNTYQAISGAKVQTITVSGATVIKATFEIKDGGEYDMDGVANGRIVDPSGVAQSVVGAPNTGLGGPAR